MGFLHITTLASFPNHLLSVRARQWIGHETLPLTPTHTHTQSPTTQSPTTEPPSPVPLPIGAIVGGAVGGVLVLVVILVVGLLLCFCMRSKKKGEYVTGSEGRPWMVVRRWDPRSDHTAGRGDSLRDSRGSRRSRSSSIASSIRESIRESIRRMSGRRRSGKGGEPSEDQVAMKVTPL